MSTSPDVTALLDRMGANDGTAANELLPLVYGELRKLAQAYINNERSEHTLQATALVHEAYMRLVRWENVSWQNRAHFFSVAATVMRKVLVDHARKKRAGKRGSGHTLALDDAVSFSTQKEVDILRLEDALSDLAKIDKVQERIVELRFYAGLSVDETAEALGISATTVKREWVLAKAWLFRELSRSS